MADEADSKTNEEQKLESEATGANDAAVEEKTAEAPATKESESTGANDAVVEEKTAEAPATEAPEATGANAAAVEEKTAEAPATEEPESTGANAAAVEEKTAEAPATEEPVVPAAEAADKSESSKTDSKPPESKDSVGDKAAPPADSDGSAKAAEATDADSESRRARRGRPGAVSVGIAHVKATFNNTVVSITDTRGGVIAWSSAGRSGFKGSRKSTAFAATLVAQDAARQAVGRGMHEIEVRVQGAGAGRESAIRALQSSGLNIAVIKDITSIPHNGCRARKRRRV